MTRTFRIEIRNINANVTKQRINRDETRTVTARADSEAQAIRNAVKRNFDGCGFWAEENLGGSRYGSITFPNPFGGTNLYGKIRVTVLG